MNETGAWQIRFQLHAHISKDEERERVESAYDMFRVVIDDNRNVVADIEPLAFGYLRNPVRNNLSEI